MKTSGLLGALGFSVISLASCQEQETRISVEAVHEAAAPASTTKPKEPFTWPPPSDERADDVMAENYLVVLDDSGSMAGDRILQAKNALVRLANSLPSEHQLGLVFLNRQDTVPFSTDRTKFLDQVSTAYANGGTPLSRSTVRGYEFITAQASRQNGYGAYHMIIVTDGNSTDGSPLPLIQSMVAKTAVQVHVVGFHLSDHELNAPQFVDYQTASNSEELAAAFQAVTAETNEFSDPQEFSN